MSQKNYTLLLTSNKSLKTRSFSVSALWIRSSFILAVVAALVLLFVMVDYSRLLVRNAKYQYLLSQNTQLKNQVKDFSSKMDLIQVDLEKINSYSRKLKVITSGENEEDRQLELSLGKPIVEENKLGKEVLSSMDSYEDGRFPLFKRSPVQYSFMSPAVESDLVFSFQKVKYSSKKVERDITLLFEEIASKRDLLNATPSIRPVGGGWVSSGFGYRSDPFTGRKKLHKGLDFAARVGTPVYAPADGIVSYSGREGGYGKIVSIDHGYGIVTRFAHNSRLFVKTGQKVKRWEKIAEVGSTGRSSGPHLHYEVRVNGVPVDPENYVLNN